MDLPDLFLGRVFSGERTAATFNLESGNSITIEISPVKGIGFCDIMITVGDISKTEDCFMVFDQLTLYHPRE